MVRLSTTKVRQGAIFITITPCLIYFFTILDLVTILVPSTAFNL